MADATRSGATALSGLSALQVDALRELTNIGAGHAATALAQLTGVQIQIEVPRVWPATPEQAVARCASGDARVVVTAMRVLCDLTGHLVFLMGEPGARVLAELLLRREPGTADLESELERSCVQEAGNIVAAAFLNTIAGWMGKYLLPSVPSVAIDRAAEVTRQLGLHQDEESVLAVETRFSFAEPKHADRPLTGVLLFLVDGASLDAMLRALRVR